MVPDASKSAATSDPAKTQESRRFGEARSGNLCRADACLAGDFLGRLGGSDEEHWPKALPTCAARGVVPGFVFGAGMLWSAPRGEEVPLMDLEATKELTGCVLNTLMRTNGME